MTGWFASAAIGFVSGVLSGMFGIGGGIVTTPAIRLLMGAPALIAVGTPLPVILPAAITGALAYHRRGLADLRGAAILGVSGAVTAIAGAWATRAVGGAVVLIGTALLIVWAATDMVLQVIRPPRGARSPESAAAPPPGPRPALLAGIGALAGAYSGFFGLGGGFVLVPLLTRWAGFPLKRAIGTSLVTVAILAIPGGITHALLGNIDWRIAAGLVVGVVPGAALGARLNAVTRERTLRLGFAGVLILSAVWLAVNEIAGLA